MKSTASALLRQRFTDSGDVTAVCWSTKLVCGTFGASIKKLIDDEVVFQHDTLHHTSEVHVARGIARDGVGGLVGPHVR